jgi:heat shock protein HslJ
MRKIAPLVAVALVAVAILSACSTSSTGLTGKTWTLSAVTQDVPAFQGVIPPGDQGKYTVTFNNDSTFSAKADCNTVTGGYRTGANGSMTIQPGPTTLVACPPGSLGQAYTAALGLTTSYEIANGTLSLTLQGGGKLQFT